MIVFSAFTPHSPLLLESINKEKLDAVETTRQSMKQLSEDLYASHPEVLVLFSSHATKFDNQFAMNIHPDYKVDLSEFGDLSAYPSFTPDLELTDRLQRSLRQKGFPLKLVSDVSLDYGAGVPLLFLTEKLPRIKIIPLSFSELDPKEHFAFGDALKDVLMNSRKRVAVLATGDLSHALTSDSPAGFHKSGEKFDKQIQEKLISADGEGLLKLDKKMVAQAAECSYRPLLMLTGLLERTQYTTHIYSYEAPFGVGYLVAKFTNA